MLSMTFADVNEIRDTLSHDLLHDVVRYHPCITRLLQFANTDEQKNLVTRIEEHLVSGASAEFLNNATWSDESNLLHWAACHGHVPVVELLLGVPGVDINVPDGEYYTATPFLTAVMAQQSEVVQLLLNCDLVDFTATDKAIDSGGMNAWDIADLLDNDEIKDMLERSNRTFADDTRHGDIDELLVPWNTWNLDTDEPGEF